MRSLALTLLLLSFLPAVAAAQLEVGRRALDEADFRRAIRAFDRAEASEDLSHEDLVLLYEGRAMARWASGDEAEARADLARLGSIEARHVFPAEAPPELAEALEESVSAAGGAMELELTRAPMPSGSAISVTLRRDVASLTRSLVVHVRVDEGPWEQHDGEEIEVAHAPAARLEAYAEAIGPGGAVLANRGSRRAPELLSEGAASLAAPRVDVAPGAAAPAPAGDDTALIVGVTVGVGVAVVLGIVLGVVFGTQGPSDRTQPGAPVVEF